MRYFVITYLQKANGKIDEATQVIKRVRPRDLQCASVILDFKDMTVIKATANGQTIPKNWNTIHDYYLQHYEHVFRRLHRENGREIILSESNESAPVDSQSN
jgi:hypothetical protein